MSSRIAETSSSGNGRQRLGVSRAGSASFTHVSASVRQTASSAKKNLQHAVPKGVAAFCGLHPHHYAPFCEIACRREQIVYRAVAEDPSVVLEGKRHVWTQQTASTTLVGRMQLRHRVPRLRLAAFSPLCVTFTNHDTSPSWCHQTPNMMGCAGISSSSKQVAHP